MSFIKKYRPLFICLTLILVFLVGIFLASCSLSSSSKEDKKFSSFTQNMFQAEAAKDTLTLHYLVSNPKTYEISNIPISFGEVQISSLPDTTLIENYQKNLSDINRQNLNNSNQLLYDIIKLSLETELSGAALHDYDEYLNSMLGIQSQLPVLLAEYEFRTSSDIKEYLKLLSCLDTYFEEILSFEEYKASKGLFMSTASADSIIQQCSSFVQNPESNYLHIVFQNKLESFSNLSKEQKDTYIQEHLTIIQKHVIPAYKHLISGLSALKKDSKNQNGLFYFPKGKEYYEYLMKSQVGCYDPIETIRVRLLQQLVTDCKEADSLISKNSTILQQGNKNISLTDTPEQILTKLQTSMKNDFPALSDVSYEVKTVDSSLESYLSPAFYLTPPIDEPTSNTIYINPSASLAGIELFTTLAHEGFPGHMYQTIYFMRTNPDPARFLFSCSGYIEGWATYIESYAYNYGDSSENAGNGYGHLLWLNRSINLCICSLLDLGIHYYGWTIPQCQKFLQNFGITDSTQVTSLYQTIVETPTNYLKYYLGYLNFYDLKKSCMEQEGKDFDIKEFHKKILTLGPCPFPILQEYMEK